MKLALVSPLPPIASPAARLVERLLPSLRERAELRLLPHAPEHAAAEFDVGGRVEPAADLPLLLEKGSVDVPVYVVADTEASAFQLRYVREHPGVLVLLSPGVHRVVALQTEVSGDLEGYRALLVEEHGAAAQGWPERFLWRADRERVRARLPLTGVMCRRSQVVVAPQEIAAGLRRRHPDVPVVDLPALPEDASAAAVEAWADAIVGAARQAHDQPRDLPDLPERTWPKVEVVVVGYNARRILAPALQSLAAQDYPDLTTTLVDNASTDGTAEFVRENFPWVRLVASPVNLGFAGGNNRAFAETDAKYVVLFNQDAVARADFVRELVRVAERDGSIAAVGAKMLMLRCPTILNSAGIVVNEAGFAVDRRIGEKDDDHSPVPERVFGACGGAKLIRTSVIREIGGFDPAFFMYFEDVDFCWRMRLAGYQVLYAPMAVVHHDWHGDLDAAPPAESGAAVAAKTYRRRFLCERNRLQALVKNYEPGNLWRVLRALRRYDKVRLGWCRASVRAGREVEYFAMVGRAIRAAWRYLPTHAFGLWRRRRQTQSVRRVPDAALAEFIERGVGEPSWIGDLDVIQDRFSAQATPHLRMGADDRRALGPGWYGVEPVADREWDLRWTKDRSWLYLSAEAPARRLCLRVSRGAIETDLHVLFGAWDLGSQPVASHEMHVLTFALPEEQPAADLVEVRLSCATFRPSEVEGGDDQRELGVRVAEVWLEG